jgi:hypothetical protein
MRLVSCALQVCYPGVRESLVGIETAIIGFGPRRDDKNVLTHNYGRCIGFTNPSVKYIASLSPDPPVLLR